MTWERPEGLWLGAAAVLVLALFLRRRRRREVTVPFLPLWEEVRSRSRLLARRRLKGLLSLLLHLAALALLTGAAAGPAIRERARESEDRILIVDTGAATLAREADGRARWERIREAALREVDALRPGDTLTLIEAAGPGRVAHAASTDRAGLADAVESLEPGAAPTAWEGTLELARAAAAARARPRVLALSPFAGPAAVAALVEPELRLGAIGSAADNAGFVDLAFEARWPDGPDRIEYRIRNLSPGARKIALAGGAGGERELPPGGELADVLEGDFHSGDVIELRLAGAPDAFALDDVVRVLPPARRRLRVRAAGAPAERAVLAALLRSLRPLVDEESGMVEKPEELAGADLVLWAGPWQGPAPACPGVWFGDGPPELFGAREEQEVPEPTLVDWARGARLLRDVDFSWLVVGRGAPRRKAEGVVTLVEGDRGPLLLLREGPGGPALLFTFGLVEASNLFVQPALPVLVRNLALRLSGAEGGGPAFVRVGEPYAGPGGTWKARLPGLYPPPRGQGPPVVVNLLDAEASDVAPLPVPVERSGWGPPRIVEGRRDVTAAFLVAGLVLLVLEAALYHLLRVA